LGQGAQRGPGISADADVQLAIHAQFWGLDINLNETYRGRKGSFATQSEPVIKPFPDYQNQICLAIRLECRAIQRRIGVSHAQGMSVRDNAARHRDGVERKRTGLDELSQLDLRAGPPDSAAGNHNGAFRWSKHRNRPADFRRVWVKRRKPDGSHDIRRRRFGWKKVDRYGKVTSYRPLFASAYARAR
jgi:hypothetical protein